MIRALALGAIQGPAELLPISSSAHVELAAGLLPSVSSSPRERKAFEVALHAGAGAALGLSGRTEVADAVRTMSGRRALVGLLATLPPALAGLAGRRAIEDRLSSPAVTAVGLVGGGMAMAIADRANGTRGPGDAGPADGLALGMAQAAALVPGVSRNGATLAVARARGFTRDQAARLSWGVALPVLAGALALEAPLLARGLRDPATRGPLLAGTVAAAASTAFAARLTGPPTRGRRLWPFSVYRLAPAALALRQATRRPPGSSVRLNGPVSSKRASSA